MEFDVSLTNFDSRQRDLDRLDKRPAYRGLKELERGEPKHHLAVFESSG